MLPKHLAAASNLHSNDHYLIILLPDVLGSLILLFIVSTEFYSWWIVSSCISSVFSLWIISCLEGLYIQEFCVTCNGWGKRRGSTEEIQRGFALVSARHLRDTFGVGLL